AYADEPEAKPPTDGAGSAAVTEPPSRVLEPEKRMPETRDATEPTFVWKPFGFVRLQYIAVQDDPNVPFVGRDDGFELQNARVGFVGRLADKAAVTIALERAVDERAQVNSPDGKLKPAIKDAYGDVVLSGAAVARAGYFQAWVDPEALVPDTARELVDHPIESRGMRATEGYQTPGLTPGRSLGAAIHLDPAYLLGEPTKLDGPGFGIELAVQNGADEYASNNDNNLPAVSLGAVLRLPHDSWLMAAGRWNARSTGDLPFRRDETDYQGTVGVHVTAGPLSLGGGLVVQHTTFDSTGGPSQDAYGGHAQALIAIPAAWPFAVGYRFGILDPSNLIVTDRVMEHTLGAVLGVPSYRMRLQLQLTHVQEQAARDLANDRIQLAAEVAL
ncbi:MAG: hypothetical protein ABI678_20105, partial [Kofleriaceae bacterium]